MVQEKKRGKGGRRNFGDCLSFEDLRKCKCKELTFHFKL